MTRPIKVENSFEGDFFVDGQGDVQPVMEEVSLPHPVRSENMPHDRSAVGLSGRAATRALAEIHRIDQPTTTDTRGATASYSQNRKDTLG